MTVDRPGFTLHQLAQLTQSQLIGQADRVIFGVDDLESATSTEASFLDNPRYENRMLKSDAGVIFIHPSIKPISGKNFLVCESPTLAFQKVIELFIPQLDTGFSAIHPTAVIHESVQLGSDLQIGPHVVIDKGAIIGSRTTLDAGVCIGSGVNIGQDCHFYSNVVIRERSIIGSRVIIQPGAVIGSCGYGYYTDKKGTHTHLKQLGNVIIEDDVEIGANTTIDRARFKSTIIGKGTKIDNLVQIAHQVHLGEHNLIVSQSGVAGSSKTGKRVVLGGQVGVIGHIFLGDDTIFAARSAPIKSIEKAGIYSGAPAIPIKEFNEQAVYIRQLPKLVQRFQALEKKLAELEKSHHLS